MLSTRFLRRAVAVVARPFSVEASSSSLLDHISSSLEPTTENVGNRGGGGGKGAGDNLGRRLLNLAFPKRSAIAVLRKWIEEGNRVQKHQLIQIIRHLRKQQSYKHALEIFEWITIQKDFRLLPGDYAVHLDLIAKVRGLASAEKFFEDLPDQMKKQSPWTALLHAYVQNNMPSKAEAVMKVMADRGLLICCLPYNHMINLYLSNGQLDRVPKMIEELKKNTLPDVVTYNLWLTACADGNDLKGAEKVLVDMRQRNIVADWITYSTLTKLYIKGGLPGRARKALKEMEKLTPERERKAYCSLLTLHASLSDKDDINRIWNNMKSKFKKMSDAEYLSMISCLVKLGDIEQAEGIYSEWESVSGTRDPKVSNILLSAYTKNGMMEKACNFLQQAEKKGTRPNYNTWEIMTLGYLQQSKMDEVLACLEKAFASLKKWEPNDEIIKAMFEKLEMVGDTEGAEKFLLMLRKAGHVTTQIYNLLLRTYEKAGKMPLIVIERMTKDKVQPDDETKRLLESTNRLCASKVLTLVS